MRLRVRDLSTGNYPTPFALMCAWAEKKLDQIDFDECEVIHVTRAQDQQYFRDLIEERKLTVTLRWDQLALLIPAANVQHSWHFVKGNVTYYEAVLANGETMWTKFTYNDMNLITEVEQSGGHKLTVKYDAQGTPVAVEANECARETIVDHFGLQWCPQEGILDCRIGAKTDDDDEDGEDDGDYGFKLSIEGGVISGP